MSNPTTKECIEWCDRSIADFQANMQPASQALIAYFGMIIAIRAQLIAAQEMAKALENSERKMRAYLGVCKDDKELSNLIIANGKALTLAREAGII